MYISNTKQEKYKIIKIKLERKVKWIGIEFYFVKNKNNIIFKERAGDAVKYEFF